MLASGVEAAASSNASDNNIPNTDLPQQCHKSSVNATECIQLACTLINNRAVAEYLATARLHATAGLVPAGWHGCTFTSRDGCALGQQMVGECTSANSFA